MSVGERLETALHSPVASRFFAAAAEDGLDADALAEPATSALLGAQAAGWLSPWTGDFRRLAAQALAAAAPLRDLAGTVLADPRNEWWFAPVSRVQRWLREEPFDRALLAPPVGPLESWEDYAQRTSAAPFTADELPVARDEVIRSTLHAQAAERVADWMADGPLHEARLHVGPSARVYEIRGPGDWHALVRRYGGSDVPGDDVERAAGCRPGRTPTWSAVAADWDGVHLTFFGFLTSLFVPVTDDGPTTTLWAWGAAQTLWLRDVVGMVEELPVPLDPAVFDRRRGFSARA